jgi:hypothetical protein
MEKSGTLMGYEIVAGEKIRFLGIAAILFRDPHPLGEK